jgi:hypothetical protein
VRGRHGKKSKLGDDDRIDTIMEYLLENAPKSCYDGHGRKERECNCLSLLDAHSLRNFVALWTMWFARDKFLNKLYKQKMSSVKKWQMFSSSTDLGLTKM